MTLQLFADLLRAGGLPMHISMPTLVEHAIPIPSSSLPPGSVVAQVVRVSTNDRGGNEQAWRQLVAVLEAAVLHHHPLQHAAHAQPSLMVSVEACCYHLDV